MKLFLQTILAIGSGLATVLVLSLFLLGPDQTRYGVYYWLYPFVKEELPRIHGEATLRGSAITGEEHRYADASSITSVKPVAFTKRPSPLLIPTNGVTAHKNFLYDSVIHPGVDIWTNFEGGGLEGTSKGYPVYAACSGTVTRVFQENEEIEIVCEPISEEYKDTVPSLDVKILYSHMGDGRTRERYHSLRVGQRVTRGELVGYQGNVSSFVPENIITHLHFGVYDMSGSGTPPPLDPEPYIGIPTKVVGQVYTAGTD